MGEYDIPTVSLRLVRDGNMESQKAIHSPADVGKLLVSRFQDSDKENFIVVHLDTRNKVQSIEIAYTGSVNAIHIRLADLFKGAILANAAAIIIAHNHPSGDPSPSPEDIGITQKIRQAAELLDIELLDHVIVGYQRFISLRERGLGGPWEKGK